MPSRFPGIDPYIEGQRWKGFHSGFLNRLWDALVEALRPRYIVDVEESVYVVNDEEFLSARWTDVSISENDADIPSHGSVATAVGISTAVAPSVVMSVPMPRRVRQTELRILRAEDRALITVIELLSPWNKTGDGRDQYLAKRTEVLSSHVNLVELDLLRGGERLPVVGRLPAADFYAFVCRGISRPRVDVFPWTLRQPLPRIPIPLAPDDDDLTLDLQPLFTTTYDRAGYDYALNYKADIVPPLNEVDQTWAAQVLSTNSNV